MSLRPHPDYALSLLAVMGLVWVADVFAYFSGKAFGKHKIAPTVSPGKSWEGAIGGAICVAVYMTVVWWAGWLTFDAGVAQYRVNRFGVDCCQRLRRPVWKAGSNARWASRTAAICCPDTVACSTAWTALIAVISVYAAFESLF